MNSHEILLILAFFALVLVPAPFLGRYCFKVMEGQRNLLSAPLAYRRVCYRLFGVDPASEQDWKTSPWRCWHSTWPAWSCCSRSSCCRAACR